MSASPHPRAAPRRLALLSVTMLLGLAACSERTTAPVTPELRREGDPSGGYVWVCKTGPAGTYTLNWTAATPTPMHGSVSLTVSETEPNPCKLIYNANTYGWYAVTVGETDQATTDLVAARIWEDLTRTLVDSVPLTDGQTVTVMPTAYDKLLVELINAPAVCRDQGAMNYGGEPPCLYGRLGDFVWIDEDGDGQQEAGEAGIPGVTVTLSGAANATTTTDATGHYYFEHLGAGNYTVTVGTPTGYAPTTSLLGTDRAIDSNGSPTGTTLSLATLEDLTLDFGFVAICTDPKATNYGQPGSCEYPPETTPCPAGSFTFTYNSAGDLLIKYDQFPAPNDNSYGINAVGWISHDHKFSDLVGSDHAGIMLLDPSGTTRLSFNVDYLSANSSAPSGYASLGVLGGDGKMLVGTATGITATTSLANNLNNINIPGLFSAAHVQQFGSVNVLINSPPTDPEHLTYNISDPLLANWDFHDTYYVTISAAKLASIGFDRNTWQVLPNESQLHNSPAKECPPSGEQLSVTKYEVKDKQVKITILNSGGADAFLTALTLTWPQATNGNLLQIKLDGDVIYNGGAIGGGSANLSTAQLVADQNKRKINHGSSDVYTLIFANNADPNLGHYTGTVTFGSGTLTVLPH